jgi:hypothetical protein
VIYVKILFLIFLTTNIQANTICMKRCSCKKNELKIDENYSLHKSSKKTKFVKCQPVVSMKKINACLKAMMKTNKDCKCDKKTRCLTEEEKLLATLDVTTRAPMGCGYKWKGFNSKRYRTAVANFIKNDKIDCMHSMCTSAVFLAFIAHLKKLKEDGKISQAKFNDLSKFGGKAYKILNNAADPSSLVKKYGLGKGIVVHASSGKIGRSKKIPKAGDIVQLWRKNKSGHSVIFKGFADEDGDGRNDLICYWSSQGSTKGFGNRCENISVIDRMLIGSLNG